MFNMFNFDSIVPYIYEGRYLFTKILKLKDRLDINYSCFILNISRFNPNRERLQFVHHVAVVVLTVGDFEVSDSVLGA